MSRQDLGRGPVATADMKARIAALRSQGADVIETLIERHRIALTEGHTYEYAGRQGPEPLRPAGQRRQ